jgi:DEAD/DEAH box helicase domain-containing protein
VSIRYNSLENCLGKGLVGLVGRVCECDTIRPMRYVIFDLETQNTFSEVNSNDPAALDISVATVYDSEDDKYTTVTVDEIDKLWPIIERADALVGYNSNHFDIPLLNKYYPGDLTQIKSIDLLEDIKKSLGRRLRLDSVAEATVGAKKSADGLQAVRWWKEGNIKDIMKYCEQDVKVTKEVFEFARKNGFVRFKDGAKKREIPLDTAHWEEVEEVVMTHSMLF